MNDTEKIKALEARVLELKTKLASAEGQLDHERDAREGESEDWAGDFRAQVGVSNQLRTKNEKAQSIAEEARRGICICAECPEENRKFFSVLDRVLEALA